jgi:hypothetical protein
MEKVRFITTSTTFYVDIFIVKSFLLAVGCINSL